MSNYGLQSIASACLMVLASGWVSAQSGDDIRLRAERVREHIREGRYVEAEAEALDAIRLGTIGQGGSSEDLDLRDVAVEALLANGRGVEPRTRELAEENLRTVDGQSEQDGLLAARIVRHLGDVLFQSAEYDLRQLPSSDGRSVCTSICQGRSLWWLPRIWTDLASRSGNPIARPKLWQQPIVRSLSSRRSWLQGCDGRPCTLQLRGLLQSDAGNYEQGRKAHEAAVALHEAAHPRHPETALSLCQWGEQLRLGGDLVKALEVLKRAVALTASRPPPLTIPASHRVYGVRPASSRSGETSQPRAY